MARTCLPLCADPGLQGAKPGNSLWEREAGPDLACMGCRGRVKQAGLFHLDREPARCPASKWGLPGRRGEHQAAADHPASPH